ncbi:unnamed protein product [Colias eurytheme]|nr:unnamed protein product [Colias eurytheme]
MKRFPVSWLRSLGKRRIFTAGWRAASGARTTYPPDFELLLCAYAVLLLRTCIWSWRRSVWTAGWGAARPLALVSQSQTLSASIDNCWEGLRNVQCSLCFVEPGSCVLW